MEKQGITSFLWRILARRLLRWAQIASLQAGEEISTQIQGVASAEDSASDGNVSAPRKTGHTDAGAQSVDGDPPAHWLAQVSKKAPEYLQQKSGAARVPFAPLQRPEPQHVAEDAPPDMDGEQEELEQREVYRPGSAGAPPSETPRLSFPLALSNATALPKTPAHVEKPSVEPGEIPFSLPSESANLFSLAPDSAGVLASHRSEASSGTPKSRSTFVPVQDATKPSSEEAMTTPSLSGQNAAPSSFFFSKETEKYLSRTNSTQVRTAIQPEEKRAREQVMPDPFLREKGLPGFAEPFIPSETSPSHFFSTVEQPYEAANPSWSGELIEKRWPDPPENFHAEQPYEAANPPWSEELIEKRWPDLPENFHAEREDWDRARRAWERQQRLDREQRGDLWNV